MSPSERYAKLMGGLSTPGHAFPVGEITLGRVLARFPEVCQGFYRLVITVHRGRAIDDCEAISGLLHDLPADLDDTVAVMWLDLAAAAWALFDEQEGAGQRCRCLTAEDVKVINAAFPPEVDRQTLDQEIVSHSPLPWAQYGDALIAIGGEVVISSAAAAHAKDRRRHQADLALIRRAVNQHSSLVEALREMVDVYREGCADEDEPGVVVEALAAIAKAERPS